MFLINPEQWNIVPGCLDFSKEKVEANAIFNWIL